MFTLLALIGTSGEGWVAAAARVAAQPTYFATSPIASEMAVGRQIAGRRTASLMSCALGDRLTVGKWYDGMMSRDAEHALWLSPRFVSRVLGFLERREMWGPDEAQRRWDLLRPQLEGKLTFIVELCALKKVSMADLTPEVPATTRDIERVTFRVEIGEGTRRPMNIDFADQSREREKAASTEPFAPTARLVHQFVPTRSMRLAMWQVRDRKTLLRYRWWLDAPLGELFTPTDESTRYDPIYPLGEYYGAWYWVQSDAAPGTRFSPRFKLLIESPSKVRVAEFRLGNATSPQP
jgi:hypothetical protein